jgi:predicted regulator of Ras-like GTPase activity (Roadblock/LC7/MglB family)
MLSPLNDDLLSAYTVALTPHCGQALVAFWPGRRIKNFTLGPKIAYPCPMFKEALERAVVTTDSYAGLLMDFEGIPVESYVGPGSPFDIEIVGAEISVLVKQILRAAEMLEAGGTEEVSFRSERMTTLVRIIDHNYFIAMTMAPNGNAGRGRYALRLIAPELAAALV